MQEQKQIRPQNAILEGCKRLVLSGVRDILNFDEQAISLDTELDRLEIRGEGMRIVSFDTSAGDMCVEGYIYALVYTKATKPSGFFKKVFK